MRRCHLVLVGLLLLWVPGLLAQSLGEVAGKERQKREKEKEKQSRPTGKVFTDDDLANYHRGVKPSPTPSASSGSPERPSDAGPRDMEEKQWRATAEAHRAAIRHAEQQVADVQAMLDRLNSGLAPRPTLSPNMYQTLEARRQSALADLETAKRILMQAKQDRQDFEELARRGSIPPGWLRE